MRLNPFLISVSENRAIFVYSLITMPVFVACVGCQRCRASGDRIWSVLVGIVWHSIKSDAQFWEQDCLNGQGSKIALLRRVF